MADTIDEDHEQTSSTKKNAVKTPSNLCFSLTYGFYVVMGGFVVDVSDMHDKLSRLTLTPTGVLHLAKEGLCEQISDDNIRDKSKADWLGKGLVILQVLWMMLQCISRKAAGYPLSPLEVHTLVHAGCALFVYFLWFKKPLDIKEPTVIEYKGFENRLALMLVRSPKFGWVQYGKIAIPEGFMRVRQDNRVHHRWPDKWSSEASYLVFKHAKHNAKARISGDSTETEKDSVPDCTSAVRPSTYIERRPKSSVQESSQAINQMSGQCLPNSDIEAPLEEQPTLTWRPQDGLDTTCTLTTGDILIATEGGIAGGIGPQGFPLQQIDKPGRSVSQLKALRWKSKRAKSAKQIQLVEDDLRKLLPLYNTWHHHNKSICKLSMSLSAKDVLRWSRAAAVLTKSTPLDKYLPDYDHYHYISTDEALHESDRNYLTFRSPNLTFEAWYSIFESGSHDSRDWVGLAASLFYCALFLLGILYGAVHLTLWNYEFATPTEMLLWRISSTTLLAVPALLFATSIALVPTMAVWKSRAEKKRSGSRPSGSTSLEERRLNDFLASVCYWPQFILGGVFFLIRAFLVVTLVIAVIAGALLFVLARVFIVVESFISLRHVPLGVYIYVEWTKYIPHF